MDKNQEILLCQHLESFFRDMKSWETETYATVRGAIEAGKLQDEVGPLEEIARHKLTVIFDSYGITGRRSRSRIAALACSDPPEYDFENQLIQEIEVLNKTIRVTMKQLNGLKATSRYTFTITENNLTFHKKEILRFTGKWEAAGF